MVNGQSRSFLRDAPGIAATFVSIDKAVEMAETNDTTGDTRGTEGAARYGGVPVPSEPAPVDPALWRRRLRHDIQHELGTIIMLASAIAVSDDIGSESKERVELLIGE